MYKLVDEKVTVYSEKDLNSSPVTELIKGDVFEVTKTYDSAGGMRWAHIELPDKRKGYAVQDIKAIRLMSSKQVAKSVRQMRVTHLSLILWKA